ncbi:DUF4097 family beta strand repeat-containing protein [Kineococcus sp. SYSU DK006]|uniref:DUF4097 family beta strand repeat-containing protein n=1 Tax=Kineococcus sp. SYSU DK006 TaxID=3383127 RepID=UPI003D7D8249
MSAPTAPPAVGSAPAPARRPRGRAAFAVAAAVLVAAAATDALGEMAATSTTRTDAFAQVAGTLTVVGDDGDVDVRTGPATGELTVTTTVRDGWSRASTSAELVDGALRLSSSCGGGGWLSPCQVSYVVTVPEDPALELDVRTGAGDQSYRGTFAAVRTELGVGDLDWSGAEAQLLVVDTGAGDVDVEGAVQDLAASTGAGDVEVDLESAPQRVDVRTGTGDASVRLPAATPYRVEVDSGLGDEQVEVASDPASPRLVRITTSVGDASVEGR